MLVSSVVVVVVGERLVGGSGIVFRSVIIKIIVIVILILHKHSTSTSQICTDNCENIHQHSHITNQGELWREEDRAVQLGPIIPHKTYFLVSGLWCLIRILVTIVLLFHFHFQLNTFFDIQTVGGYFTWMTIYAVNQTMIQRYLTVKDLRYY